MNIDLVKQDMKSRASSHEPETPSQMLVYPAPSPSVVEGLKPFVYMVDDIATQIVRVICNNALKKGIK